MSFENTFSKEEIYAIGKHLAQNGEWIRKDDHDGKYAMLCVRLPYEADLSSTGSRVDELNKIIEKTPEKIHFNNSIISKLESLLEQECEVCGDVDGPQWKECGCDTQGFNKGIKKAIAIIEEK